MILQANFSEKEQTFSAKMDEVYIQEVIVNGGGEGNGSGDPVPVPTSVSWNDITDKPFGEETTAKAIFSNESVPMVYTDGTYNVPMWVSMYGNAVFVPTSSDMLSAWNEEWDSAKITIDGVEFVCEPLMQNGMKGIGNPVFVLGDPSADNGIPFLFAMMDYPEIGAVYLFQDTLSAPPVDPSDASQLQRNATISIETYVGAVKTLDIKYIPAELYTEIDTRIDRYIEEALGGDY